MYIIALHVVFENEPKILHFYNFLQGDQHQNRCHAEHSFLPEAYLDVLVPGVVTTQHHMISWYHYHQIVPQAF